MLYRLIGGARERRGPGYAHDARRRPGVAHVVVQLTLAGEGAYEDAAGRRPLAAGSAFVAPMPGPYRYWAEGPYELLFAGIAGEGPAAAGLRAWLGELRRRHGPVVAFAEPGAVADALRAVLSARGRHEASARAYGLMMAVLAGAERGSIAREPRVAAALALIERRAGDARFGVAELAGEVGCSREHLARLFRQALGQSPAGRLSEVRVRRAAGLLRAGDDKLAAVAARSGFASAGYLCRVFRRRVGVTPGEFRQRPWLAPP